MNPLKRPVLSVCVVLGVTALTALGTWQIRRLVWKNELIATVDSRLAVEEPVPLDAVKDEPLTLEGISYRKVYVTGVYLPGPAAHVFGTYESQAGWYVFQPFQYLKDPQTDENPVAEPAQDEFGGVVLINRGFVPVDDRAEDDQYDTPGGVVRQEGIVRLFPTRKGLLAPKDNPEDHTFYTRWRGEMVDMFFGDAPDKDQIAPVYLDSTMNTRTTDRPQGGTTRVEFNNRHLGYAITWYGLAIVLIAVYAAMMRRSEAKDELD